MFATGAAGSSLKLPRKIGSFPINQDSEPAFEEVVDRALVEGGPIDADPKSWILYSGT
jgi:hypothetical protein